jgi:endoglucanase
MKGNLVTGRRKLILLLAAALPLEACILITSGFAAPKPANAIVQNLDSGTTFYVPEPNPAALAQIADLRAKGEQVNAELIQGMLEIPQAVWFTDGTPQDVEQQVANAVQKASLQGAVPVLVAYYLPFRDCSQYSAGGATSVQEYLDWIDGFAAGISNAQALVILEPDGLGIIPYYTDINGDLDWCQPADADPETAAADRFLALNGAVDRLVQQRNVDVYLDATHSRWLSVGDIAQRLVRAGVQRASGFFLNASNFQPIEQLIKYGPWIARCIWYATDPGSTGKDHFDRCASQYFPADVDDFSTWTLTDQWYTDYVESQASYPGDAGLKHFVIDTSRNGQGRWIPPADLPPGDPQEWCNPPARGLGKRPTANTGLTLLDAYLWMKIPGESDGQCYRWTDGPLDPIRGMQDPPAGQWFSETALELAQNANPPLLTHPVLQELNFIPMVQR